MLHAKAFIYKRHSAEIMLPMSSKTIIDYTTALAKSTGLKNLP